MKNQGISIVVPVLNEQENVRVLVKKLHQTLRRAKLEYELIFVDDHSTDQTREILKEHSKHYPLRVFLKTGKPGKAYSLLQGFAHARYELVAMIDADLQYPPEAIPAMVQELEKPCDIVIANRRIHNEKFLRKIISKSFSFFFTRLLHGLDLDTQSGLKVFRRQILQEINLHPTAWTFDLEFLIKARHAGYQISTSDITFQDRRAGRSKINIWEAAWEIGLSALKLKFTRLEPVAISPLDRASRMRGGGLAHKHQRFITHTSLPHESSALLTFRPGQTFLILYLVSLILISFYFWPLPTAIALMAILSAIYFIDVVFYFYLVLKSLKSPPEIRSSAKELATVNDAKLPVYTILCPLYQEANVVSNFVEAIAKLDWPKDKLEVLLLLEEDDQQTISAVNRLALPKFVRSLVVPYSYPKTKPKACNYGLSFAHGEYLVVYDAEDMPEPSQLKKAYLAFQKLPGEVKCLQAKLNYYNPHDNFLTRLFTAEYSLWFDLTLTGLQSLNTYIPLGGTSNHFRLKDLLDLRGWDPFNVTEDCDLGARLFKRGFKTAIIDSLTLEEANSNLGNWFRQRSRWIKGYMQTYLVHMRRPLEFFKDSGIHALIFQLVVGGKIAFLMLNPLLWLATISYFTMYAIVGPTIEALFPAAIFYIATISLVFGNFLFFYSYMIGCAKRGQWSLLKYVFFVPIYWLMGSIASGIALYQLFRKPHYWEKTVHGLQAKKVKEIETKPALALDGVRLLYASPRMATKLVSGATFLVGAMMLSNFLNFLFNAFLGRTLGLEELGLVTLINTLWFLVSVLIGAVATTVNYKTAFLTAAEGKHSSHLFLRKVQKNAVAVGLAVSLLWIVVAPYLARFFNLPETRVLFLFTPVFTFGILGSTTRAFLNGSFAFGSVATLFLVETFTKFLAAVSFVYLNLEHLVFLSIPLAIVASGYVALWFIPQMRLKVKIVPTPQRFPGFFFAASLLAGVSATLFLSLDIILVKHFLAPRLAGEYVLLSLVGKMIYFLGSLPGMFLMTLVGRDEGLHRNPLKTFHLLFFATFVLASLGLIFLGPLGPVVVPWLLGAKTQAILAYLPIYTLGMAFFTLSSRIMDYHLARKDYEFPIASFAVSGVMFMGILWFHGSVAEIARVIFVSGLFGLGLMSGLHLLGRRLEFLKRNLVDLFGVFGKLQAIPLPARTGKRILVFNWRDTRHVFAGGAEVYLQEIAKHWVKDGNQVTIFCGNDGRSAREETIDGVKIIRRGGFYFVYVWAFWYYLWRFRGNYDLVIDCQNGIPFFAPLYAGVPVFCLMHHVHQEVFRRSLSKPLAALASFLEKDLMPAVYRNIKFITVSESSKVEIQKIGLAKAGISVVHPGINLSSFVPGEKSATPTILYLGRLKAYKSVDILIKAFQAVLPEVPEARLLIAGSGEEEARLKKLAVECQVAEQVEFYGKVSEEQKISLLQQAWVFVNPSFMEGWGITTIEANACGTPVVAANVAGLRDSVQNPHTGYLVTYGDPGLLADRITRVITDQDLRENMVRKALAWANNFDWQKSSKSLLSSLENL